MPPDLPYLKMPRLLRFRLHRHLFGPKSLPFILAALCVLGFAQERTLELSRTDRPWEFLSAVGTRAGLFGDESGRIEAWVYPLKLLRNFHVQFEVEGGLIPAGALARTVLAHPESCTILYTGDTFAVRETFFVPVQEAGAVVLFEIES